VNQKPVSSTDRLIADLELSKKLGDGKVRFEVGRFTGNGPAVIAALRKRGYSVAPNPTSRSGWVLSA
jgi:hypothetical protein